MVFDNDARLLREKKTVGAMIKMYCQAKHGTGEGLCDDCRELLSYAIARLNGCPFGKGKTTCVNCAVHCYKPMMRKKISAVMRYAGPRMIYRHPILTLFHYLDGLRKEPVRVDRKEKDYGMK